MTFQVTKIINGNLAAHGEFSHQVSLQVKGKRNGHFCGATIIHPLFLLTAAHCFKSNKPPHIEAVAGEHDLMRSEGMEQVRLVTRLIVHEDYNETTVDNDIAFLVLNESLQFNDRYVRPVAVWNSKWKLPRKRRELSNPCSTHPSSLPHTTISSRL